jgi:hypothetical protein
MTIAAKIEGVEVEVSCGAMEGEGTIENPSGTAAGRIAFSELYKKCAVIKPGGTCKVAKETFRFTTTETGTLIAKGATISAEMTSLPIVPFGKIVVEGCENAALNKSLSVSGTAIGEYSNEKSTIKFTGTSGSSVKFDSQAATFNAETKLEVAGGGKIQVG